jgi:hypothetical protein
MTRQQWMLWLALAGFGLRAQPVESEMDKPLDLSKRWSFYRDETTFLQHRCSGKRARSIALIAAKFFRKAENYLGQRELILPLHLRIYADAEEYRRTLRFSRYREAHYNPRLLIATAHCEISATLLEEQLALFWLADAGLRTWQRLLLAEALPRWEKLNRFRLRIVNPTKKRAPLLHVLLSDHTPEPEEQQTLAEFVAQLVASGRLKDFLTKLYRERDADDTGLDALEAIFPGITRDLLSLREPDLARYNSP